MEEREMRVIFGKDGKGGVNSKVSIPITWLRKMNVTPEERDVKIQFDEENEQIVIKKQK